MINILGRRDGSSAVDYTINPSVGFPAVTGPKDDPRPVNHLLPAWDCITGKLAAVGLLAAERHRTRTGEGQLVKLALADVAMAMLGKIAEVMVNDSDRPKDGNYLYGAFGRDFETLDGKRLMFVALTPAASSPRVPFSLASNSKTSFEVLFPIVCWLELSAMELGEP